MKPQPLRVRVLSVLRLAPMPPDKIARCLACSRGAAQHNLDDLIASGDVVRVPRAHMRKLGRRPFIYAAAA